MSNAPEKLELLARQARALAASTSDRKRADALRGLAVLYDRQAAKMEAEAEQLPELGTT